MSSSRDGLWVNALVGAVVTVVVSFIPFSPLLGGGVAGYLQKGDDRTGLKVGALSGAIASVPMLLLLTLVFGVFSFVTIVPEGGPGVALPLFVGGVLLVATVLALVYVVGLSAVGGLVGVAIARERTSSAAARADTAADVTPGTRDETDATTADAEPGADPTTETESDTETRDDR